MIVLESCLQPVVRTDYVQYKYVVCPSAGSKQGVLSRRMDSQTNAVRQAINEKRTPTVHIFLLRLDDDE
jgi:hypothetical protein